MEGETHECFVIGEPAAGREQCRRLDQHCGDYPARLPENADERRSPVKDQPRVAGELAVH